MDQESKVLPGKLIAKTQNKPQKSPRNKNQCNKGLARTAQFSENLHNARFTDGFNELTKRKSKMKPFGTSMTTKLTMRAAIALVIASASATWCLATPSADISSAGPLTHVWVGNDLSCQAQHIFDATEL